MRDFGKSSIAAAMTSTIDMLKRAKDRVEQTVFETVGSACRTELGPELIGRLSMAEDIRVHIEAMLQAFERHIPNDERLLSSFSTSKHSADVVAASMKEFARTIDKWPQTEVNEYSKQVFLCGEEVFKALSRAEKSFVENSAIHFLAPMKLFLSADMKKFEHEKKLMLTARVDMDFARNKATKMETEQNTSEATRATAEFHKQKEIVEEEIDNLESKLLLVRRSIGIYIDDHVNYLESSLNAVKKLQDLMRKIQIDQLKEEHIMAQQVHLTTQQVLPVQHNQHD